MRSTRSNDPAPAARTTREDRVSQTKPPASIKQNRVLQTDPVARRNAPLWARRDSSIATNPVRPDDETEFFEDEDDKSQHEEPENQNGAANIPSEESDYDPDFDPETLKNLKILEQSVPDLARAADSLYTYMQQESPNDEVFQGCLDMKRRAFYNLRNDFKELGQPCEGGFVDFASFIAVGSTQQQKPLVAQIARVNTVIAYDEIYDVEDGEASGIFTFLKTLNQTFPDYFILDPDMFQHPEVILDLRTWLVVEAMSRTEGDSNVNELLVEFFCDPRKIEEIDSFEEQKNYPMLLAGQYFRELGASHDINADELCSTRIVEIGHAIKKKGKGRAIAQLTEKYPLQRLLINLRAALDAMHKVLTYEESVRAGTQPPYPDQQIIVESQSDVSGSESQSIIRAETEEVEPSLFVNKRSLLALERGIRASSAFSPSNEQLVEARSSVPRDYHEDSNADLMRSSFPPASSFRLVPEDGKDQYRGHKRPRDLTVEDDDDDAFETDDRRVDPAKRDDLRRKMPPPPRPESISRPPPRRVPVPTSPRSVPPTIVREPFQGSTLQAVERPSSSSIGHFEALKIAASQRRREALMADPERQVSRQRVPWSDNDSLLLIECIKEWGVRWSTIQSQGQHLFEHPRNQQAYRDRARNIKTELLILDRVLPPNFNDVALGNKEIVKIQSIGKNPYRKEEDIDADGNPVNTELR
ncbi:unnamed protein product [Fusarium equiseti]|uniref:Myb-like domain-containing protein n=1 Tax=Fusarium equiseti TaxID=61235 RepID=A0A8J2IZ57_FUSEQ|nr:unnamed protein product [Fusarium equiseti]